MDKASTKDFFREILKNKGRFISIIFIVLLGTAFFAGLRSTSYDMKYSADLYFDETKLMDIRVISTMGLEEEDIESIRKVSGVKKAVGSYSVDALCVTDDDQYVIKVIAECGSMNKPVVTEGRLPRHEGECFLDAGKTFGNQIEIGDTICLTSGDENDLKDTLNQTEFKVVGKGYLPYYMDLERGTSTIGDGALDTFIVVPKDTFCIDYYTVCYVHVKDADKLNTYSEEYKNLIDTVKDRIEAISEEACSRRLDNLTRDARNELADAKLQVADGERELKEAADQIADGKQQIRDAELEISENEQKLKDAEQDMQGYVSQIEAAESQISSGLSQIEAAEKEIAEKRQELQSGEQQYEQGLAEYEAGLSAWEAGKAEFDSKKAEYEAGLAQYEAAVERYDSAIARYEALGIREVGERLYSWMKEEIDSSREAIESGKAQLDAAEVEIEEGRNRLDQAKEELDQAKEEIENGKALLEAGEDEIRSNRAALTSARQEVDGRKADLSAGQEELADGWRALEDGKSELEEKRQELLDGEAEYNEEYPKAVADLEQAKLDIQEGEEKLRDLEQPEWYVLGRDSLECFVSYEQNADRMESLGKVFPVIFFLVAALVSLTAMTRMVEEQRMQIGTMKALGYSNAVIAGRFFWYAILATLTGSVIGIAIGERFLPYIISTSYGILYTGMTEHRTPINWDQALLGVAAATASTGLATLAATFVQLRAKPAELMRPTAPKGGKRVLLERLGFLWKHLKFSRKATVRNLLRYKKRFIMTIIGVGGCMGLLLVGYGLIDSITEIAKQQFINIFTYEANVTVDTKATDQERQALYDLIEENSEGMLPVSMVSRTLKYNGAERDATLFVPMQLEGVEQYLCLRDRKTKTEYDFPEQGAALAEKTADMLGAKVGDTIAIYKDETSYVEVEVTGIVENYVNHYIYISKDTYEEIYGESPKADHILMNYDAKVSDEAAIGNAILAMEGCNGFSTISSLEVQIDDMLGVLNDVMWVLIVSAGLLAFVVLYNLNSINITERKRELATLKVLGFYDNEVSMYVFRENIILTAFGIVFGLFFGTMLHRYTVMTVEVDLMMFGREISKGSYIMASLITMGFSIFVNLVMNKNLKDIDMIESLKSVE